MRCRFAAVAGCSAEHGRQDIERFAVAGVADRVDRDLEAGLHRCRVQFLVETVIVAAHAAVTRLVGVVVEQARAAGTQRAVVVGLDRARDQHAVAVGIGTFLEPLANQVLVAQRQHRVDPDRQAAVRFELFENAHLPGVEPGVVDGRVAVGGHALQAEQDLLRQRFRRWRGHGGAQHLHGLVEEQPGRLTVGADAHLPADRHGRFGRDAGLIECHLVTPAGKTVQAVHEDRVVRDLRRQQRLVRVAVGPGALVPAAADDPFALRYRLCALDDQVHGLFLGCDADQVHLVQQRSQPEDVRVRIDETRDHRGAAEIDDPRRIALELHGIDIAADEQYLAAPDCDGLRVGMPAGRIARRTGRGGAVRARFFPVQCVDAAVDEYQAGIARFDRLGGFVVGTAGYKAQHNKGLE